MKGFIKFIPGQIISLILPFEFLNLIEIPTQRDKTKNEEEEELNSSKIIKYQML